MTLIQFVSNFIHHNSMVRLVYKNVKGYKVVAQSWNDVCMAHEIVNGTGIYINYLNVEVDNICSILVRSQYSEAINIVIKSQVTLLNTAGHLSTSVNMNEVFYNPNNINILK